ncbi:MFS transporter [Bradyrhizobium sp. SZCCHNR2009]|uniref:MFS transporter n=1 Tax=Bradyrhizobium sp. SZCCHNR2009 TaxID=3057375 RepID=UPI0028E69CAD|nr:MFS transporter [Bradyrhizobium sp. SZCCHNR2009]
MTLSGKHDSNFYNYDYRNGCRAVNGVRDRNPDSSRDRLPEPAGMPLVVYLLGLTIFALTTSEFMVAGMSPALSAAFAASVAEIGYLVSLYALSMAIGGPLVIALLLRLKAPNKPALLLLLGLYVAGGVVAALAPDYGVMAIARIVTGAASSACFGVALAIAAELVAPQARGRAASIVLGGLMLAPVLGLPATTAIEQGLGWRASFWSIAVLAMLSTVLVAAFVPDLKSRAEVGLSVELDALRKTRLWAAYTTSGLIIGATFAAFSYAVPLFIDKARLSPATMPVLLAAYGGANVFGNLVVGRFADRYTIPILFGGLIALALALLVFAVFATNSNVAVLAFLAVGVAGVPMNPAMVARVMRIAHPGPLVNTVHTSAITAGLAFGAWAGGVGIDAGYGLTAPLWVGLALALLGLLSLAPSRMIDGRIK